VVRLHVGHRDGRLQARRHGARGDLADLDALNSLN
jgi:hypothetical protein